MQVWAVLYDSDSFADDLYQRSLPLVDEDSVARIKRFYRREDACRTLIGRLLPRILLKKRGISVNDMSFAATETNKPYITTKISPSISFNVSHDNGLIAMAFSTGTYHQPAFSLGIDVMRVSIPSRETFLSFVNTMKSQLTKLEQRLMFSVPQEEALQRFFWIWTLKEAYTKALGLGLGFDFSRVEFDIPENTVRVDGAVPRGWRFNKFTLQQGNHLYQGVVAEYLGEDQETLVVSETEPVPWLEVYDAVSLVEQATQDLQL